MYKCLHMWLIYKLIFYTKKAVTQHKNVAKQKKTHKKNKIAHSNNRKFVYMHTNIHTPTTCLHSSANTYNVCVCKYTSSTHPHMLTVKHNKSKANINIDLKII